MDNVLTPLRSVRVPRCSLRARGGSSPCSPCSARSRACAWLRVAARGSGPGAKRRRPCPPLRAVATWKASGRRASRRIDAKRACRPGVEQRADREAGRVDAAPLPIPAAAWPVEALGAPYSGFREFSASDYRPRGGQPSAAPKTARRGEVLHRPQRVGYGRLGTRCHGTPNALRNALQRV